MVGFKCLKCGSDFDAVNSGSTFCEQCLKGSKCHYCHSPINETEKNMFQNMCKHCNLKWLQTSEIVENIYIDPIIGY